MVIPAKLARLNVLMFLFLFLYLFTYLFIEQSRMSSKMHIMLDMLTGIE